MSTAARRTIDVLVVAEAREVVAASALVAGGSEERWARELVGRLHGSVKVRRQLCGCKWSGVRKRRIRARTLRPGRHRDRPAAGFGCASAVAAAMAAIRARSAPRASPIARASPICAAASEA